MEQHELPAEARNIIRPLQIEMAQLREQSRQAERGVLIALRVAIAMMGLDAEKPYRLSDDGKVITLDEGESDARQ